VTAFSGSVIQAASTLPNEVWMLLSALVSGGIAVLAVALQNKHDANQRALERASELRKTIYLDALDYLGGLGSLMNDFWNLRISEEDIKAKIGELKSQSERLHAVAGLDMIRALDEMWRAVLDVVAMVTPVRRSHRTIVLLDSVLTEYLDKWSKERDEITATLAGSKDLSKEDRVALEEKRGSLEAVLKKRSGGFNRSLQHRMEFIRRCQESQGLAWSLIQS
jgi:hypothetical protein